ncbi:MAG: LPS assembly lipoprotein LptE [Coraliomargaritaceae bacterium]
MLIRDSIKTSFLVSITSAVLFLSGCANYHMGDSAPLPFHSIYILPAVNESFAPLAVASVSAEIREAFIRDGRVVLVTKEEEADAVLTIDLTDYDRTAVTRESEDTVRARDFRIRFEGRLSLFNQTSGNYYFQDRSIVADTNAYVGNPYGETGTVRFDYRQAEQVAMSRLARDLARQAASAVLANW